MISPGVCPHVSEPGSLMLTCLHLVEMLKTPSHGSGFHFNGHFASGE